MSLAKYIKTQAGEAPGANKPAKVQGLRTYVNERNISTNQSNQKH